jgi:PhoH-like ATPase
MTNDVSKFMTSDVSEYNKIYAVDTNIILEDIENLALLSDNNKNLILISNYVIKELDKFKKGNETINVMARRFSASVESEESELIEIDDRFSISGKKFYRERRRIKIDGKRVDVEIFNPRNKTEIEKEDDFDSKIIKSVISYKEWVLNNKENIPVIFVSLDYNARISARSEGLISEPFKGNKYSSSNKTIEFVKSIKLAKHPVNFPEDLSELISKRKLKEIQKYNIPVVEINTGKNRSKIYYVKNGQKYERMYEKKDFENFIIKPKNLEQKIFVKGILSNNDIIVCEGEFGSGKTLMALEAALNLQNNYPGIYQKIVYIRRTILSESKNAEIGFLPGTKEEKMEPFVSPLKDNIELLILSSEKRKEKNKNFKKSELKKMVEEFEDKYNIEYEFEGHLRGRTIANAIVIVDEVQNNSIADIKLLLSRIGQNSKVILIGSLSQIDDPYLNKYNNALAFALNESNYFRDDIYYFRTKLSSVVRGRIANYARTIELS